MIDFREEISKYKPVLGLDEVEEAVTKDDGKDMLELLQQITKQIRAEAKE